MFQTRYIFLLFADCITGINGCTPWETLHTIDQGLLKYQIEAFCNIIRERDSGKPGTKHYTTNAFDSLSATWINRAGNIVSMQSSRTDYIANTYMIAQKDCGNQVVFLVSCYVTDVKLLVERVFSKHNNTRTVINGPTVKGCSDAVESLLCPEKWIMGDKPVGKSLQPQHGQKMSSWRRNNSFLIVKLHRSGTSKKWTGVHAGTNKQLQHGNGQGAASSDVERMHNIFLTQLGGQAQIKTSNFMLQVAQRQYKAFILEQSICTLGGSLVDLGEEASTSFDNNADSHLENIVDHLTTD